MKYSLTEVHNPTLLTDLGIDKGYLDTQLDYLITKLDEQFLDKLKLKYSKRRETIHLHLLYDGLLSGVLNQNTIELLELVHYLKELESIKGFDELITGLRVLNKDNFLNYFFQTAITFRLHKSIGIKEIEPEIDGKTPDLSFDFKGSSYVAEMTYLSTGIINEKIDRFLKLLSDAINKSFKVTGYKYVVLIRLKHPSYSDHIQEYIKDCQSTTFNKIPYKIIEDSFVRIEIIRFDPNADITGSLSNDKETKNYSRGITLGFSEAGNKNDPATFRLDESIYMGKIMIDTGDLVFNDEYSRIEDAIRRKVPQLIPLAKDYKIILFVFSEYKWTKLDSLRLVKKLHANFIATSSNIFEGIAIVSKYSNSLGIHKYGNLWIECHDSNGNLKELDTALMDFENSKFAFI